MFWNRYNAEETALGRVLMEMGATTIDAIEDARRQQKKDPSKLGDILVRNGTITVNQLETALEVQGLMRSGRDSQAHLSIVQCHLKQRRTRTQELRAVMARIEDRTDDRSDIERAETYPDRFG